MPCVPKARGLALAYTLSPATLACESDHGLLASSRSLRTQG